MEEAVAAGSGSSASGKCTGVGFEEHPGYAIAKEKMRGFGGMMRFT